MARSKAGITRERILTELKPGPKRYDVRDGVVPGLEMRINSDGSRVWSFRFRLKGDINPKRFKIGEWPEWTPEMASARARALRVDVDNGIDPCRKADPGITVKKLAERFEEEYCPSLAPSTVRTYKMLIKRYIVPKVGDIGLLEFSLGDAGKLHHSMRKTPRNANQALAVLSKMLNIAELWGLRGPNTNPCSVIKRFPENKRDRYMTLDEMAALGKAIQAQEGSRSRYVISAFRFELLTGMRRGEVSCLRWHQVQDGQVVFHASEHKTGSKTGKKVIMLSDPAKAILREMEEVKMLGSEYVFPGDGGGPCTAMLRKLWDDLRRGTTFEDVRFHDLRHTFASMGIAEGLSLEQIGGLLGHRAAATTKRYAHLIKEVASSAAEKTAGKVLSSLA